MRDRLRFLLNRLSERLWVRPLVALRRISARRRGVRPGTAAVLFLDEQPDLPELTGRERANVRIMVPYVDAIVPRVASMGAVVSTDIADRSYGLRDFTVRDPDGVGIRFATRLPS